ncbi:transposase, partial [Streptomyces sp. H34-S4]|nr:transposase [Streptomyces sp. H34-S4]
MAEPKKLRQIARTFVADPASGVCVRDRLKGFTVQDEKVLRLVGAHLGSLASTDLAVRVRDGLEHSTD